MESESIFLADVSFLVCYKFDNLKKETGLNYYNVIPVVVNAQGTKHKDLRTGKIYSLVQADNKSPNYYNIFYEQILKDYGINSMGENKPDYCYPLDFNLTLSLVRFGGVREEVNKKFNDVLPNYGESFEVFLPISAVVLFSDLTQIAKRKTYADNDLKLKKEAEKRFKMLEKSKKLRDF